MFARIKHVAMVSDQYALQGKFYESLFGMTTAAEKRSDRAVTVGDGYVGLNINPRKPGRPARRRKPSPERERCRYRSIPRPE